MDRESILKKIEFFNGLTDDEISAVANLCEERTYQRDEAVLAESSRGEEIYILKSGKIRIDFALRGEADKATVDRISGGQVFGELALVDKGRRSATARCESECEVFAVGRDRLYELFESRHHIGYVIMKNIAEILARRLRKTNLQLIASILWE